jgi:ferredoxin
MRGILEGMGLTFSHLFRPKVTRLYPYEKPKLPPRSRGLIQLISQEGLGTEFNLKCESCLLCEKACPPRAITIEYEPLYRWKRRPWFKSYIREGAEKFTPRKLTAATGTSKAGFYSQRIAEYAVEYHDKPVAPCVAMPVKDYLEPEIDLAPVDALLETWPQDAGQLPALLDAVMDTYGYLPLQAAKRIVQVRGVDLSDIFGIATMSPKFKPAPAVKGLKRDDQPRRGLSPATRGVWGNINHVRQPNA